MYQINFRVKDAEKSILKKMAEISGMSIAEFAKRNLFEKIGKDRVDLAFDLLKKKKIGRHKTLVMSGLSIAEFHSEWTKRGAEDIISEEMMDLGWERRKNIKLTPKRIPNKNPSIKL